jgi:hypothetical protein
MGRKSLTGLVATAFAALAFLFIFIAFVSPYWLETDGKLKDPKFLNIGELFKLRCGPSILYLNIFKLVVRSEALTSLMFF